MTQPKDICGECGEETCPLCENGNCNDSVVVRYPKLCHGHGHPTHRPSQEAMEEAENLLCTETCRQFDRQYPRKDGRRDHFSHCPGWVGSLDGRKRVERVALALDHAKAEEQIICAAIRAKNGKIYPCAYHGQGIEQRTYQQKYYGDDGYAEDAQGFITSRNRFVDRFEGLAIALAAGQVEENRHGKDRLMSEDLPYNRFEELNSALSLARKGDGN